MCDILELFPTLCDLLHLFPTVCDLLDLFLTDCDRSDLFPTVCDRLDLFPTLYDLPDFFLTVYDFFISTFSTQDVVYPKSSGIVVARSKVSANGSYISPAARTATLGVVLKYRVVAFFDEGKIFL